MVEVSSNRVNVVIEFKPNADLVVIYRVFKAMEPEFKFRRGSVLVNMGNDTIVVTINADDVSSARSLINGVLKHLYLVASLQSGT